MDLFSGEYGNFKTVVSSVSCENCGLYRNCKTPFMKYTGKGKKKILIVGESPGETEDKYGKQFIGRSGKLLRKFFKDNGIDVDEDCWLTNAVRCHPLKNKTPTNLQIKSCRKLLLKEIEELKPKVIFLFGRIAVESLLFYKLGNRSLAKYSSFIGEFIPDKDLNAWVIPVYHPSYLLRNEKDIVLYRLFGEIIKQGIEYIEVPLRKVELKVSVLKKQDDIFDFLSEGFDIFSFDIETTGLKPHKKGHKIKSIAITYKKGNEYKTGSFLVGDLNEKNKERLLFLLKNRRIGKIAHNLKYEHQWIKNKWGISVNGWIWDTMIAEHVLHNKKAVGLKFLSYVKFGVYGYDDLISKYLEAKGSNGLNKIDKVPVDLLLKYNGYDSLLTYYLYENQLKRWEVDLLGFYLFLKGQEVFAEIQENGLRLDLEKLEVVKNNVDRKIQKLKKEIMESKELQKWDLKEPFLIDSVQHLRHLFFDLLGLETDILTNKGEMSVNVEALSRMNSKIAKLILEYRRWRKVYSTYIKQFEEEAVDGIVRPFFNLSGVSSYRSCVAEYEKVLVVRDFEKYPDGLPIKDVKVGDYVYCFDDNLNLKIKKVLWAGKTGRRKVIRIHYYRKGKRGTLDVTPEHKVRLINGQYVEAKDLLKKQYYKRKSKKEGKCRVLACHQYGEYKVGNHIITKIEYIDKEVDVYDLEVEDSHNFIVNEICVHNSSQAPNFQNIPKRDKEIKNLIRGFLIPREGNRIIEYDYKSMEVIISACYNRDKNLMRYVQDSNSDMHRDMAKQIFMKEDITKQERYLAKNGFVFPAFYGSYYKQIAPSIWERMEKETREHLKIKGIKTFRKFEEHIKKIELDFWGNRFFDYKLWKDKQVKRYERNGYISLLTGFKVRPLMRRNDIVNYPIQGSAFHCLLWTLIKVYKEMKKKKFRSKIIGQIHDAIVMDVYPEEEEEIDYLVWYYGTQKIREYWDWLILPLTIEKERSKINGCWAEMEDCGYLDFNK